MALIKVKDITKHYKIGDTETVALGGVSLSIEAGEFVAIIGPSGSGKSTLMHILGLLDTPTTGSYLIDGREMQNRRDRELAKLRRELIGFVFQSFNLLPRLSVVQNVMLPMTYAGLSARKRKPKAMELLKLVGIEDRANHKTNQISGGQTQRVAVARALANDPRLILADEPTGNLDTAASKVVIDQLRDLHKAGNTIMLVTHNPEIAAQTDRTIEIRDGKIVKDTGTKRSTAAKKTAGIEGAVKL